MVLYMSRSFALGVPVASLIAAATVLPPMFRSFIQETHMNSDLKYSQ